MTLNKLAKEQEKAMQKAALPFETAKKIREILDAAEKEYDKLHGAGEWEANGIETDVLDMVTEE